MNAAADPSDDSTADKRQPAGRCDHCGLPLSPGWFRPRTKRAGPEFCCFGCRFAADVASQRGPQGELNRALARLGLAVFLSLNVMMFTMVLWTSDVYRLPSPSEQSLAAPLDAFLRYLCLLLSLPVLWLLGVPLAQTAWSQLRGGQPGTDLLLLLGVAAAALYSAVSTFRDAGHVYFEVACGVLVLVTLGRWLEATGRTKATEALDGLTRLLPAEVRKIDGEYKERLIPLAEVTVGDRLLLLPGERVPLDGRIVHGQALLDQQIITGESRPVECRPGDLLFGGALNLDGALTIEVTAGPQAGTLQRLIEAVRQARLEKGRYQLLADRVSRWFLPLVVLAAGMAFAWHGRIDGLDAGLLAGLAVVLIACPCALGLATPLAAWTALSTAARGGVLIHHVDALERLASVRVVAFDKTGTLTTGQARVAGIVTDDATDEADVWSMARLVAGGSSHALARAIIDSCPAEAIAARATSPARCLAASLSEGHESDHDGEPSASTGGWRGGGESAEIVVRTLAGRGLSGEVPGMGGPVLLGNTGWMEEQGLTFDDGLRSAVDAWLAGGRALTCIGWDGAARGAFCFDEAWRPTTGGALEECRRLELAAVVLTGDHAERGRAVADELRLPVLAGLLPTDKVAALATIKRDQGPVAMVGDGVNDAPALAAADVGLALESAADLSRQSADVSLLGDDLSRVPWVVKLSRRTVRVMRQNLFWAFAYNTIGIGLALGGWLNPIWAAAAMVISSVIVVGNSLRLAQRSELSGGGHA